VTVAEAALQDKEKKTWDRHLLQNSVKPAATHTQHPATMLSKNYGSYTIPIKLSGIFWPGLNLQQTQTPGLGNTWKL